MDEAETQVWTQQTRVRWRPSLAFFENRFAFLGQLKDGFNLSAFRVAEDHTVEALLERGAYEVSLSSTTYELSSVLPGADPGLASEILRLATEASQPSQVLDVVQRFGHLAEMSGTYEEVRDSTGASWFRPSAPELGVTDHATLWDGETDDASFQIEFGIVERNEIRMRLEHQVGRVSGGVLGIPPTLDDSDFPEVALFAGSRWEAKESPEANAESLPRWVDSFRNTTELHAVRIVDRLKTETANTD